MVLSVDVAVEVDVDVLVDICVDVEDDVVVDGDVVSVDVSSFVSEVDKLVEL